MKVKLIYFKPSGKYYSERETDMPDGTPFWKGIELIIKRLGRGDNPGLNEGAVSRNAFDTYVDGSEHDWPPHLITHATLVRS